MTQTLLFIALFGVVMILMASLGVWGAHALVHRHPLPHPAVRPGHTVRQAEAIARQARAQRERLNEQIELLSGRGR